MRVKSFIFILFSICWVSTFFIYCAPPKLKNACDPESPEFVRILFFRILTKNYISNCYTIPHDSDRWSPNVDVQSILPIGNKLYIGGNFTHIGPRTGQAAIVDKESGQLLSTSECPYFQTNGIVRAFAKDESGAIYIGGSFTLFRGKPVSNLVKVLPDCNLDTSFNPSFIHNSITASVNVLLYSNGVLYVGGNFTDVQGEARVGLVSLDPNSATLLPWNPNASAGISDMVIHNGLLYVAGGFSSIGGQLRNRLAALNLTDASATGWNPNVTGGSGQMNAILIRGNVVYFGGSFGTVNGGTTRANLAAVALDTGTVTAWYPTGGTNAIVNSLAEHNGILYVGGSFTTIGGVGRNYVAGVDASSAVVSNFDPSPNTFVQNLFIQEDTLYISGSFRSIGGVSRYGVASLSLPSGSLSSWDPNPSGKVNRIFIYDRFILLGGEFTSVNGVIRRGLAEIDNERFRPTDWDPELAGPGPSVKNLIHKEGILYIGGTFTGAKGKTRTELAAFQLSDGSLTEWNPNITGGGQIMYEIGLATDGIYVAGNYTNIGSQVQANLAKVNFTDGTALNWNPLVDGEVYSITSFNNQLVFSGSFATVNSAPRTNIAAIFADSGTNINWDPDIQDVVSKTRFDPSGNIILAGDFIEIEFVPRSFIGALQTSSNLPLAWNPGAVGSISTIFASGSSVFVAGSFTNIGGQTRNGAAKLTLDSALATEWNPKTDSGASTIYSDEKSVYLGGSFQYLGLTPNYMFAIVDPETGSLK